MMTSKFFKNPEIYLFPKFLRYNPSLSHFRFYSDHVFSKNCNFFTFGYIPEKNFEGLLIKMKNKKLNYKLLDLKISRNINFC